MGVVGRYLGLRRRSAAVLQTSLNGKPLLLLRKPAHSSPIFLHHASNRASKSSCSIEGCPQGVALLCPPPPAASSALNASKPAERMASYWERRPLSRSTLHAEQGEGVDCIAWRGGRQRCTVQRRAGLRCAACRQGVGGGWQRRTGDRPIAGSYLTLKQAGRLSCQSVASLQSNSSTPLHDHPAHTPVRLLHLCKPSMCCAPAASALGVAATGEQEAAHASMGTHMKYAVTQGLCDVRH